MNIKPATTGDTENGRSISVMSSALPRNSNLAIAHAAARPKMTLSGADHATGNVEFDGGPVRRDASALSNTTSQPLENACTKTLTSGNKEEHETENHRDADQRPQPAAILPCRAGFGATSGELSLVIPAMLFCELARHCSMRVDHHQQCEREHQQHHRQRHCPA